MPTGINPERQKGIPLTKAALALTPLTIGVLSACSNNPAMAKPPEGVTPIATDTATAIIPMTPAHAPSIIPASPTITVEVSPLPPSKATETITTTVPVITPTVGTPLPIPGTPFAVPSATETIKPTTTVTKTVVPTATNDLANRNKPPTQEPTLSPETIANQEVNKINITYPGDTEKTMIKQAAIEAVTRFPYGLTAKDLNNYVKNIDNQHRDFRQHFNDLYGKKYGIYWDDVVHEFITDLTPETFFQGIWVNSYTFGTTTEIGTTIGSKCGYCCAIFSNRFNSGILLAPDDLTSVPPLWIKILKEAAAGKINMVINARIYYATGIVPADGDSGHMAEMVTGALQIYTENQVNPNQRSQTQTVINTYYNGGIIY